MIELELTDHERTMLELLLVLPSPNPVMIAPDADPGGHQRTKVRAFWHAMSERLHPTHDMAGHQNNPAAHAGAMIEQHVEGLARLQAEGEVDRRKIGTVTGALATHAIAIFGDLSPRQENALAETLPGPRPTPGWARLWSDRLCRTALQVHLDVRSELIAYDTPKGGLVEHLDRAWGRPRRQSAGLQSDFFPIH